MCVVPSLPPSLAGIADCITDSHVRSTGGKQHRGGVPQRYPVVVYLHGGEFKYGGKDLHKPDILLKQDVILVVPNYRLGVLGKSLGSGDRPRGS